MTTYLCTHSLRGDAARLARYLRRNRTYILLTMLSLALLALTRQAANTERVLRGTSTAVVGGEAFVPALPWLVRVIWESVREVIPW